MAAFAQVFGIPPADYWRLRLDEAGALRKLLKEIAKAQGKGKR